MHKAQESSFDLFSSRLQREICKFELMFNRAHARKNTVPSMLKPFVHGEHYLSTKQVASATLLARAGSASVESQKELLRSEGFSLRGDFSDMTDSSLDSEYFRPAPSSEYAPHVFQDVRELHEARVAEAYSQAPSGTSPGRAYPEPKRARLEYEDPWLVIAGRTYAECSGMSEDEYPQIKVWSGDGLRIQDPLPRRLLGPEYNGKAKNQTRFVDLVNVRVKLHVIRKHTHWGRRLTQMMYEKDGDAVCLGTKGWAHVLHRRLLALLEGRCDPQWREATLVAMYGSTDYCYRNQKARATRLLEVLKTVDGMFQQRYFAFPEERWTWEKYDLFVLSNLSWLIQDEFFDGELSKEALNHTTRYSELKKARKTFKEHAHKRSLTWLLGRMTPVPQWLNQFLPLWEETSKSGEGTRYTYLTGLLSQTRGCGTPPPLVILQSKEKFLKTVTVNPTPMGKTQLALIDNAVSSLCDKIPREAFTGLNTKARITITTSASWERTRKEGGTLGHIHTLVNLGRVGHTAPIRDLNTGQVLEERTLAQFDSPGEFIFWYCLDEVLKTPPEELRYAFLTVVKEPGKGRSVTKARSYLKVVLDLVSKICAEPLKKGLRSSQSGMGKSHHAWNFFTAFFESEQEETAFRIETESVVSFSGYTEHTRSYRDLFVSSTDFQAATDSMQHEFAERASRRWMTMCGIPPILQGIVVATCYRPRKIFFFGSGALEEYGVPEPLFGEGIRSVTLRQGVLMGDPLTKIILHIANIATREIAIGLRDYAWLDRKFTNPAAMLRDSKS